MATAQAKALNERDGRYVHIVGADGRTMWSEVFENNRRLVRSRVPGCHVLRNGPGFRPYIANKTAARWYWKQWDRLPGELFLSEPERHFARPYAGRILVEPHTKVPGGNKAWPWDRWVELIASDPSRFIQVGPVGARPLPGVQCVPTSFRQACAILEASRAFVGTEGALHHAAAALGIPAVVLWSEFIAPEITGYPTQTNIRHAGAPCGSRVPCATCAQSMAAITVGEVAAALGNLQ